MTDEECYRLFLSTADRRNDPDALDKAQALVDQGFTNDEITDACGVRAKLERAKGMTPDKLARLLAAYHGCLSHLRRVGPRRTKPYDGPLVLPGPVIC